MSCETQLGVRRAKSISLRAPHSPELTRQHVLPFSLTLVFYWRDGLSRKGGIACIVVLFCYHFPLFIISFSPWYPSPTDFNSPLQTVLLCSPCKDVLCDMEERFWNSIYRLKNALSCGRVLPGAGEIEATCIRRLTVGM